MDHASFLKLIEDIFECQAGSLKPEDALLELPGWDSVTFLVLIAEVDHTFGVTLDPAAVLACSSIGDLAACIQQSNSNAREAA